MSQPSTFSPPQWQRRNFLTGVVTTASLAGVASAALAQNAPAHLRFMNPQGMAVPRGYSHVVEVKGPGRTVYIAGQLGFDASGKIAGGPTDFRAQAVQVFENLKTALAAVGADFGHVVKLNSYLTDITAHIPILREVRDGYIKGSPPASTTVQIGKLARDGALLEIEAIAALPA